MKIDLTEARVQVIQHWLIHGFPYIEFEPQNNFLALEACSTI